jgi:hypothetical protein
MGRYPFKGCPMPVSVDIGHLDCYLIPGYSLQLQGETHERSRDPYTPRVRFLGPHASVRVITPHYGLFRGVLSGLGLIFV